MAEFVLQYMPGGLKHFSVYWITSVEGSKVGFGANLNGHMLSVFRRI